MCIYMDVCVHVRVSWAQVMVCVRLKDNLLGVSALSFPREVPRVKSDPEAWQQAPLCTKHLTRIPSDSPQNILSKNNGFYNNLTLL